MIKLRCIGPNQTELQLGGATFLFSYETPVAYHRPGGGFFRTEQKFSSTTSKHINNWLKGMNAKVVPQHEIESLLQGKDNRRLEEELERYKDLYSREVFPDTSGR